MFLIILEESPFIKACNQVSEMIDSLRTHAALCYKEESQLPKFLASNVQKTITGLSRLPLVNSYARIPPIVWKFGWMPVPEGANGTELPPLPVDILKEKDVLKEFVFRVNQIGDQTLIKFKPIYRKFCLYCFFHNENYIYTYECWFNYVIITQYYNDFDVQHF